MAEDGKVQWKHEDDVHDIQVGPWWINGEKVMGTDGLPVWCTKGQARAEAMRLGLEFEEV
jgi:hypothetical protein